MTRREFGFAAAGALSAASAATRRLRIGIGTYSYHNLPMQEMVAQFKALQVDEIEMSRGEFMLLSHPKPELFETARAMLDRAGIRCVSYYAATIRNETEADMAVRYAGMLGASNITGDGTGTPLLKHIDRVCTRAGLTFGIHNHFFQEKFPYESAEDVLSALEGLSPTVGATADTGQFASCGHDPVAAIRKLGRRLKLVHLKDVAAKGAEQNVILGTGVARIAEVMKELKAIDFRGLVAVEYEKEGPVEDDLRREVEIARRLA